MGEKGARQTREGADAAEQLVDDLAPLGAVTSKKMFGGHGLFHDGVMFAIVDSGGAAFLRADDGTAKRFEAAGSDKHGRMPYWRIPAELLADAERLLEWAGEAVSVAHAAKR